MSRDSVRCGWCDRFAVAHVDTTEAACKIHALPCGHARLSECDATCELVAA